MVLNAFGTSAFAPQDEVESCRYNPYQQQSYQERFTQQKRQQEYEYEQYEYQNKQRLQENEDFAKTYGLPPPVQSSSRQASRHGVSFEEDFNTGRRSYYDDEHGRYESSRASREKKKKSSQSKSRRRERSVDDDLEGGAFRDSAPHARGSEGSEDESDDSGSDVSVSSDDSDVKIVSLCT